MTIRNTLHNLAKTREMYEQEAMAILGDSLRIDSEKADPEVVEKRIKMLSRLYGVEHHFKAEIEPNEKTELEFFLSLLNQEPGNILNIGCGSGKEARFFLDSGYDVVMVEWSKAMAKLAESNTGQEVKCCDFLDFQAKTMFDGIYADEVFHHYPAELLHKVLDKCDNLLAPKGILLFTLRRGDNSAFIDDDGKYYQCYDFDSLNFTMSINNPNFKLLDFHIKQSEEKFPVLRFIYKKMD